MMYGQRVENPQHKVNPETAVGAVITLLSDMVDAKAAIEAIERVVIIVTAGTDLIQEGVQVTSTAVALNKCKTRMDTLMRNGKTVANDTFFFVRALKDTPPFKDAATSFSDALDAELSNGKKSKIMRAMLGGGQDNTQFDSHAILDGDVSAQAVESYVQAEIARALKRQKVAPPPKDAPYATPPGVKGGPRPQAPPAAKTAMSNLVGQIMAKFRVDRNTAAASASGLTEGNCARCKGAWSAGKCSACLGQGEPHQDFVAAVKAAATLAAL
jgi:hypothetical protein